MKFSKCKIQIANKGIIVRYICTICSRVFCRRALLRRHHAVHSGFKEFTCSLCDYATSHKSNLERHMKIHESGDKYSTSSPSSSGQPIQHDRSSPEDFYQADDSSKSFCICFISYSDVKDLIGSATMNQCFILPEKVLRSCLSHQSL